MKQFSLVPRVDATDRRTQSSAGVDNWTLTPRIDDRAAARAALDARCYVTTRATIKLAETDMRMKPPRNDRTSFLSSPPSLILLI